MQRAGRVFAEFSICYQLRHFAFAFCPIKYRCQAAE